MNIDNNNELFAHPGELEYRPPSGPRRQPRRGNPAPPGKVGVSLSNLAEAYQIPTEFSAETALRTQQILADESGIDKTVDPLGGSYYVEWLTNRMEQKVEQVIGELEQYGGVEKCIEDGYLQAKVAESARKRKVRTDNGERVVVGENAFRRDSDGENEFGKVFQPDSQATGNILEKLDRIRQTRDNTAVQRCLATLEHAACNGSQNLLPYLVECCHAYATVGEMVGRLKNQWDEFKEPVRF